MDRESVKKRWADDNEQQQRPRVAFALASE